MIWVCRAGASGRDYDYFVEKQSIYLSWQGYNYDLSSCNSMRVAKEVVKKEKDNTSNTAISTWASQIVNFVNDMKVGDFVIIPSQSSRDYCLARIDGEYQFSEKDSLYCHSRSISIIKEHIKKDIFPMYIVNTLGAFRTIFRAGKEDEIIKILKDNNCI